MDEIIEKLTQDGWKPAGSTNIESVRVPTRASPLYGKSGGVVATFGGRIRMAKADWFVTIGKRTTFFYRKHGKDIKDGLRCKSTWLDVSITLLAVDFVINSQ